MEILNYHEMLIVKKQIKFKNEISVECYHRISRLFDTILSIDNIKRKLNDNESEKIFEIIKDNNKSNKHNIMKSNKHNIMLDNETIGIYKSHEDKKIFSIGQSFIKITEGDIILCEVEDYTIEDHIINNKFKFIIDEFLYCIQLDTSIINSYIKMEMDFEFRDLNLKCKRIRDIDFSDDKVIVGEWDKSFNLACVRPYDANWTYQLIIHNTNLKKLYERKYKKVIYISEEKYMEYLISHAYADCIPCKTYYDDGRVEDGIL